MNNIGYSPPISDTLAPEAIVAINYFYPLMPAIILGFGPIQFSAYRDHLPIIEKMADKFGWSVDESLIEREVPDPTGLWPDTLVTMTPIYEEAIEKLTPEKIKEALSSTIYTDMLRTVARGT